jgi:predicted  nucleic acid-binding Zn-ribbon protein
MAAKKPTKKRKASLDIIFSTIERGFADLEGKMDRGFAAVADDIADIRSTMATKADLATRATKSDVRDILRDELKPIRSDLKSIRDELDDLTEKLENVSGFRKEIDHALGRIAAIEKHLGINKKIAA